MRDGDCIIDVGANIGLFTLLANDWGVRRLSGLALEPVPAVQRALAANLARYAPGVQVLACAAGAVEGSATLMHLSRATVLSTLYAGELGSEATRDAVAEQLHRVPWRGPGLAHLPLRVRRRLAQAGLALWLRPQPIQVPVRRLSSVIDEAALPRVDLLKIDAERAEWDVLAGLDAAHWPLVRQIVMEVHDADDRLARVVSLLRAQGFSEPVLEQSEALRPFGVWQLWARRPG